MASINTFTIVGTLIVEPVMRQTLQGTLTATYVLAIQNVVTDIEGNRFEQIDEVPITTRGLQADNDHRYLTLGQHVAVTGRIRGSRDELGKFAFCFEADRVQYLAKRKTRRANMRAKPQ